MASDSQARRPLYVFDLSTSILDTLQPITQDHANELAYTAEDLAKHVAWDNNEQQNASSGTSCTQCGLNFDSVNQQRQHVRSDLHGYNLKQRLHGRQTVSEAQFEHLIEKLDESISGSDSDTSDEEEDDWAEQDGRSEASNGKQDVLSALLKRQAKVNDREGHEETEITPRRKRGSGRPPMIWFKSATIPSEQCLGIYRALFSESEQDSKDHLMQALRAKQLGQKPMTSEVVKTTAQDDAEDVDDGGVPLPGVIATRDVNATGPRYFLCMIGGGHFAAMLVALAPKVTRNAHTSDRSASVIAHKTFHRYTTRRKQGGSQSANDNAKGNAHSAGSSLRRYNEAALETDIRSLLEEWRPLIDSSELLFVRASGTTNRRILFGPYEKQVLTSRDARIRGFPFNTRRATQSELMRAFVELTRVKVGNVEELSASTGSRKNVGDLVQDKTQGKASTPSKVAKPSKEDEAAILHTGQIQALIRRSKAPALVTYITSNSLSPDFCFLPAESNYHAPTPLHLAASSNATACVTALIMKVGSDPAIRNHEKRTAFELAGDRATRDAFALARGQLGEARWKWSEAGVPAAIAQDDIDRRIAQEKTEKLAEAATEKERRQAEVQRLRKEDQDKQSSIRDKKHGPGKSMGAAPMTPEQRRMEDAKGMTDEMRLKVERERRARAAEERIRRLQNA